MLTTNDEIVATGEGRETARDDAIIAMIGSLAVRLIISGCGDASA